MKKIGSPSSVPWSVLVAVENIPDTGLHIAIDAPAATRAKLAELAALRELPQLSAVFDLTRQGAEVHVAGQVSARVSQACVVTLEPVEFLILGIDPYPRKAGAQFAPPKVADAGEHPFAALESLKKNLGGGQS
jgi:hypothetical protein